MDNEIDYAATALAALKFLLRRTLKHGDPAVRDEGKSHLANLADHDTHHDGVVNRRTELAGD